MKRKLPPIIGALCLTAAKLPCSLLVAPYKVKIDLSTFKFKKIRSKDYFEILHALMNIAEKTYNFSYYS